MFEFITFYERMGNYLVPTFLAGAESELPLPDMSIIPYLQRMPLVTILPACCADGGYLRATLLHAGR